jgi:uncharacterized membrane protein YdjX (TVP38/TMEM64 family)
MSERRAPVKWQGWLVVGLVVVGLAAVLTWGPRAGFVADKEQTRSWIQGLGPWGPAAIVLLEIAQVLFAPIPGQGIGAASGYLFGPWWGTLYAWAGTVAGSLLLFLLARRWGRPFAAKSIGAEAMARLDDLAGRGGAPFFFLIWLFPFTPDDLACLAAGLTSMSLRQFLILMILGRLPGVFISVWVGASVAPIKSLWWGLLLVAIAALALILWRWGAQIQKSMLRLAERLGNHLNRE